MGCPDGGVLCRAQGMSMNLPFLQLQPPQISKGKEAMTLKTSLLRAFFFCPLRPLWRLLRVAQAQQSKSLLQFHTGLLGLVIPSKDHIFYHFLNATATKQSPTQTLLSCSSACMESSGWERPLVFEPWAQLS